jgi:hypothetical protein
METIADAFYDVYAVLYDVLSCHSAEGWYGPALGTILTTFTRL